MTSYFLVSESFAKDYERHWKGSRAAISLVRVSNAPPEWQGAVPPELMTRRSLTTDGVGTSAVIACQQSRYSLVVSGPGKQVSLCHLAIKLFERGNVLFCFRSFRNDF